MIIYSGMVSGAMPVCLLMDFMSMCLHMGSPVFLDTARCMDYVYSVCNFVCVCVYVCVCVCVCVCVRL